MEKKLYRSSKDKILCGVCGGFAEYFNIDATIVRLVWALCCCVAAGLFAYLIAAIIMPEKPESANDNAEFYQESKEPFEEMKEKDNE